MTVADGAGHDLSDDIKGHVEPIHSVRTSSEFFV